MIELMKGLPDDTVGVKLGGTVTGGDYEKVLIPAIEEKLEKYSKIKMLYQVSEDFDKYEFSALFDDSKVGFNHFFSFDRIAVVADIKWISEGVKIFGFMMPAKVKVFSNDSLADAKKWISEERIGMEITIDGDAGIALLEAHDPVDKSDFKRAEKLIDPYINSNGELRGLIIHTKTFPGYNSTGSFFSHINTGSGHRLQDDRYGKRHS